MSEVTRNGKARGTYMTAQTQAWGLARARQLLLNAPPETTLKELVEQMVTEATVPISGAQVQTLMRSVRMTDPEVAAKYPVSGQGSRPWLRGRDTHVSSGFVSKRRLNAEMMKQRKARRLAGGVWLSMEELNKLEHVLTKLGRIVVYKAPGERMQLVTTSAMVRSIRELGAEASQHAIEVNVQEREPEEALHDAA